MPPLVVASRARTRWAVEPSWAAQAAQDDEHSRYALAALAWDSLHRGHRKVAVQRLLKLRAIGQPVPRELVALLLATWKMLRPSEQSQLTRSAREWALMLGTSTSDPSDVFG